MIIDPKARPAAQVTSAQLPGSLIFPNLSKLAEDRANLKWESFHPGVDIHWLYRDGDQGPSAALLRFQPGAAVPMHEHRGLEHIYILSGSQSEGGSLLAAGGLMVHRPGTRHSIVSKEGCLALAIYEKPAVFVDGINASQP
jgi:anti-sigma factor ChrR (cupin superfamily)